MIDWRKIEQALIEVAKRNDVEITDSDGEPMIQCGSNQSSVNVFVCNEISLTELAKELAERLA